VISSKSVILESVLYFSFVCHEIDVASSFECKIDAAREN
jgi:hypothetical protein